VVKKIKSWPGLNPVNRLQQLVKDCYKAVFTGFMIVQETAESRKWNHNKLYVVFIDVYKTLKALVESAKGDSRNPKLACIRQSLAILYG